MICTGTCVTPRLHGLSPGQGRMPSQFGHASYSYFLLFSEYYEGFKKEGWVKVVGYSSDQKEMYELIKGHMVNEVPVRKESFLENLGKSAVESVSDVKDFIVFLGQLFYTFFHTLFTPSSIRIKEMVYHIHHSGFNALMIIGLTSFLVGMVIAY